MKSRKEVESWVEGGRENGPVERENGSGKSAGAGSHGESSRCWATWAGSRRVDEVRRAEGRPSACLFGPHPPGVPLSPHRDRNGSDLPLRGPCHPHFLGNWMAQMRRRQRGCLGLSFCPPVDRLTSRHWPSCFRSSWKPSTRRSSECWPVLLCHWPWSLI